jgi:subtilisin family serine protease
MQAELDVSRPETRADLVHTGPPGRRGAGVIVGIIDSGIDWRHEAFRSATGGSRVLRIWDQNLTPQGTEASPAGFGYGVEYQRAAIDAALAAANPLSVVRHMDDSVGHGTHVAGIAAGDGSVAGNGSPAFTFIGIAPEADIVVVANRVTTEAMGDSASTLDAVRYICDLGTALGRPVVINMSQGDNLGPHDGTALLERGIDNLLGVGGRSMVKSAGNAAAAGVHATGVLAAGGTMSVSLAVPANDTTPDTIDFWYGAADRISIRITPPGGTASATVNPGTTTTLTLSNGNTVFIDSVVNHPNNGDNRIYVQLQRGSQTTITSGTWTLRLGAVSIANGRWDGWVERGTAVPQFLAPHRNDAITISVPGTAREVITAASYVTKGAGPGSLSTFSSRGPTRDGRAAPTIAAPGQSITSALVGSSGTNQYQGMSGTSMAAPHVTGGAALMLQAHPTMTQAEIIDCLTRNARTDAQTGAVPNTDWGAGKLDVQAAVQCAIGTPFTRFTRLTSFTRFTPFTPITTFTPITRFTPFTPLTTLTRLTPFTLFTPLTRFTPFTQFTRPPVTFGPIDPFRPGREPFVRFGGTVFDPAQLRLALFEDTGPHADRLAALAIDRVDQLACTPPGWLVDAGFDAAEADGLVGLAQDILHGLAGQ